MRERPPRPGHRLPIPDQVREIIRARGLTAYGLARDIGTAPSVLSRFLSGQRGLSLETFDRLAQALDLRLVAAPRPPRPRPRTPPLDSPSQAG